MPSISENRVNNPINLYAYNRTKKADDFGMIETEEVDVKRFSHSYPLAINEDTVASWNKGGFKTAAGAFGLRIYGSLPNDAEQFTWKINRKIPKGEKVLALNLSKASGRFPWGDKIFSLIVNGKALLPINRDVEGTNEDPYLKQTTGNIFFDLPDDLEEIKTLSLKLAAGTNADILIKDIVVHGGELKNVKPVSKLLPAAVNQVGYFSDASKTAVVSYDDKQTQKKVNFLVKEVDSGKILLKGNLDRFKIFSGSGQASALIDFSSIKMEGRYQIILNDGNQETISAIFEIKKSGLYQKLRNEALNVYTFLTCGEDGPYKDHAQDQKAVIYKTNQKIDISGGWHDAGDYGKYVVNGAFSVGLMLTASDYFPEKFNYEIGKVPNDSDQRSDFYSQMKTELDWMLKMQNDKGGVYHKAASEKWPMSSTAPEEDNFVKSVMPVSTTATADFAAVMARAARMYQKTDSAEAKKYLEASEKAWIFLENNPDLIMTEKKYEGSEFGGPYTDKNDRDERLWAAAELFRATKSEKYKIYLEKNLSSALENLKTGEWNNCHSLALFALYPAASGKNKALIEAWMKKYALRLIHLQKDNPYGVAVEKNHLVWGSNSDILTSALNLLIISKTLNEKKYKNAALEMLNYVLGKNPLQMSYVTGAGTVTPKQPHYRPTMSGKHSLPPGMLVGGPYSEDDYAGDTVIAGLSDKASYLRYEDNKESWTTNEIAINWNAALLSVLSILSD